MLLAIQMVMLALGLSPSLLDNQEFLAELDVLEDDVRGFVSRTPKDRGWNPLSETPASHDHASSAVEGEPPQTPPRAGTLQRLPVLLFALFVCLGASGAAAIFHDRVGQIVWHLQSGR